MKDISAASEHRTSELKPLCGFVSVAEHRTWRRYLVSARRRLAAWMRGLSGRGSVDLLNDAALRDIGLRRIHTSDGRSSWVTRY